MLFMYSCSDNLLASIRSLLLPSLSSAFFRGLQTSTPETRGFSKSYNQAAQVPSSKVTRKSPRSPSMNCKIVLALVSMTLSITTLPTEFLTQIETLSLCTSSPIYLTLVIKGCSFLEKFEQGTQNVLQRGASYNVFPGANIVLQPGKLSLDRRNRNGSTIGRAPCSRAAVLTLET